MFLEISAWCSRFRFGVLEGKAEFLPGGGAKQRKFRGIVLISLNHSRFFMNVSQTVRRALQNFGTFSHRKSSTLSFSWACLLSETWNFLKLTTMLWLPQQWTVLYVGCCLQISWSVSFSLPCRDNILSNKRGKMCNFSKVSFWTQLSPIKSLKMLRLLSNEQNIFVDFVVFSTIKCNKFSPRLSSGFFPKLCKLLLTETTPIRDFRFLL